ncbi:unnamed protein product [Penicillium pancosmium]
MQLDEKMARVCDGDTTYLFGFPWAYQSQGPIHKADDDTLAPYGLTLLDLVKGAKNTQVRHYPKLRESSFFIY